MVARISLVSGVQLRMRRELTVLQSIRHPHIIRYPCCSRMVLEARAACRHCGRCARVRLLGFSLGGGHGDSSGDICLVYELGTLGNLADVLRRC